MGEKIKIIFAAQDVGGFNAILPVIKALKNKKNFLLKVFLARHSQKIAREKKLIYQNANCLTRGKLSELLREEQPNLIFTATSFGKSIEKEITQIAKNQGIKTVALVDFWSNYRARFSDPGTENLTYLPDYVLVIDKIMKKEMINDGFDTKRIAVTGSPFFDSFSNLTKTKEKEEIITFFSQPFSELPQLKMGYNETRVFKDLVMALEKVCLRLPLKIKFHPREKKLNKFDKIIKNSGLDISIAKKLSAEDLIKKSKLILGMNTMVLFEAAMLGKTVLSYQPNLRGADPLISNRLGLSAAVYKKKDLYSELKKLLSAKPKKRDPGLIKKYTKNNSTKKVLDFIQSVI